MCTNEEIQVDGNASDFSDERSHLPVELRSPTVEDLSECDSRLNTRMIGFPGVASRSCCIDDRPL